MAESEPGAGTAHFPHSSGGSLSAELFFTLFLPQPRGRVSCLGLDRSLLFTPFPACPEQAGLLRKKPVIRHRSVGWQCSLTQEEEIVVYSRESGLAGYPHSAVSCISAIPLQNAEGDLCVKVLRGNERVLFCNIAFQDLCSKLLLLHGEGYYSRAAAHKPLITKMNDHLRGQWCKNHQHCSTDVEKGDMIR